MSLPLRRGLSMEHTGYLGNSRVILDNHYDAATQADIQHMAVNYESEDEIMSRLHARNNNNHPHHHHHSHHSRRRNTTASSSSHIAAAAPHYSKQDILEQYCISQRGGIDLLMEGDGGGGGGGSCGGGDTHDHGGGGGGAAAVASIFSCLSGHQGPSPCSRRGSSGGGGGGGGGRDDNGDGGSILTVCVRQRVPSDENLQDLYRRGAAVVAAPPRPAAVRVMSQQQYAHYCRQARYPWGPPPPEIYHYDKDLQSSYFRQYVPVDPSKYTWMPSDDESVRMERPRSILDQGHAHHPQHYHASLPAPPPPPPPAQVQQQPVPHQDVVPPPPPPVTATRPKHVSFARSHTLTSFDDAVVCTTTAAAAAATQATPVAMYGGSLPSSHRLTARFTRSQERLIVTRQAYEPPPPPLPLYHPQQHPAAGGGGMLTAITRQPELTAADSLLLIDQRKRTSMKTQATQTEACLGRKPLPFSQLHLSPRTVKMVSQGAQTNGIININGRQLTKSYSEAGSHFAPPSPLETQAPETALKHEPLQRTQSDEPPRSPFLPISPPGMMIPTDLIERPPPPVIQPGVTLGVTLPEKHHLATIPSDSSSVTKSEHDSEESESKNEILIDFKPQMPHSQRDLFKKPLVKTASDGEILLDQRKKSQLDDEDVLVPELPKASVSHEHIIVDEEDLKSYAPYFQNAPIRHEGIFSRDLEDHVFSSIDESFEGNGGGLFPQDSIDEEFHENMFYQGRWIKKESSTTTSEHDTNGEKEVDSGKANGRRVVDEEGVVPSASGYHHQERKTSPFASTDSLSTELRDQSEDGIWNESQSTVLQVETNTDNGTAPSSSEVTSTSQAVTLLTPSSRRKHLLMMQHQQRSSIDTEALDEELADQFQQLPSTAHSPRLALEIPSISVKSQQLEPTVHTKQQYKTLRKRDGFRKVTIAPTPKELELEMSHPPQVDTSATSPAVVPDLLLLDRTDSAKTTNTDMSESTTTTEDYTTANSTDSSKRSVSIKGTIPSDRTSTTAQPSSFDSVCSSATLYSTVRGDYLDEMVVPSFSPPLPLEPPSATTTPAPDLATTLTELTATVTTPSAGTTILLHPEPTPTPKAVTTLPVHIVCTGTAGSTASRRSSGRSSPTGSTSSSSGSYSLHGSYADIAAARLGHNGKRENGKRENGGKQRGGNGRSRPQQPVPVVVPVLVPSPQKRRIAGASMSDDERSAHYSSSGYYDSPLDEDTWKSTTSKPIAKPRTMPPPSDFSAITTTEKKRPYTLDVSSKPEPAIRATGEEHLRMTEKAKTLPRSKKQAPVASPSRETSAAPSMMQLRVGGEKPKRTKVRTRSPMQSHRKMIQAQRRSPQMTKSEDDERPPSSALQLTSDDSSAQAAAAAASGNNIKGPLASPRRTKKFRDNNRRKAAPTPSPQQQGQLPPGMPSPQQARSPVGASGKQPAVRKRSGSIDDQIHGSFPQPQPRRKSLHARIEFDMGDEDVRTVRELEGAGKTRSKSPLLSPMKLTPPPIHHRGSPDLMATAATSPTPPPITRLKALSAESLRSVSPGSDSVFYSDPSSHILTSSTDHTAAAQQHVHCLHCGKEVDIVTTGEDPTGGGVPGGKCPGRGAIGGKEREEDIVQPPAGFADAPREKYPSSSGRLFKKLEKRFRSEERSHHTADRRVHRYRADVVRAKSEEREQSTESAKNKLRPMARSTDSSVEGLRTVDSSPCVLPSAPDDEDDLGLYSVPYIEANWIYIDDQEELQTWSSPTTGMFTEEEHQRRESISSIDSTESEHEFKKRFQAVTHRMVHRKSCLEMYKRQASKSFESDKTVVVRRQSGEFGFRIHGSKPVVVSAIEPDTPAESSGLEIGDIVLAVNGVSVLDKSHSEVVKIAHAGSDTLVLEVARTCGVLSPPSADVHGGSPLYSGYLWKLGGQASGGGNGELMGRHNRWIRRWFSLKADNCLYYYKTDIDKQPVGAMMLSNYDVTRLADDQQDAPERQFRFCISRKGVVPLHLAGDTEQAATRWTEVVDQAIKDSDLSDTWLEQARRNLTIPPSSIQRPDCFGYLVKLGSQWKSWSRRYCVLKDACIYFYQDANAKSAFGVACLHGYRVQQSTSGSKKHAFDIMPADPTQKHYYFHTESDMDRKRWLAALEYSIDRWLKVG